MDLFFGQSFSSTRLELFYYSDSVKYILPEMFSDEKHIKHKKVHYHQDVEVTWYFVYFIFWLS